MAKTYEPIATYTAPSAQGSYTFTAIPNTYTDIVAVIQTKITTGGFQDIVRVGNASIDTGTNYSQTILSGSGTTATSLRNTSTTYIGGYDDYNTTADGMMAIFQFMNYANTSTNKTILYRGSNANTGTSASVGLWRSTSAINQIQFLTTSTGIFAAGSTFTLYGIKAFV